MTRSSTAKLQSKRKSDGLEEAQTADIIMTESITNDGAAASVEDKPSVTKRRKLPMRVKEADEQPEADEVEEEAVEDIDEESDEENDEESDDEAPETISTVQAAVATRKAAQKANRVADQYVYHGSLFLGFLIQNASSLLTTNQTCRRREAKAAGKGRAAQKAG